MEVMDIMTVFYRKRDLFIDAICDGEQDYSFYGDLDPVDAEYIYGILYVPSDIFIIKNKKYFYLEENKAGELELKIQDSFKEKLKQFI